jgi:hypothetical protein
MRPWGEGRNEGEFINYPARSQLLERRGGRPAVANLAGRRSPLSASA